MNKRDIRNPVYTDGILQDLPNYAVPLSILFTELEKYEPLLLHSYIVPSFNTASKRFGNPAYHWAQIRKGSMALQYESYTLPYELCADEVTTVLSLLFELLRHNRYCLLDMHSRFLPFLSNDPSDQTCQALLSGYSGDETTIFLTGLSQNQVFMNQQVKLESFLSAYMPIKNGDLLINILIKNDAFHEALDPHRIETDLSCFLESKGGQDTACKGTEVYGATAVKALEEQIQYEWDSRTGPITESMIQYKEHQVIMQYRMKRLYELGMIHSACILENYDSIVLSAKRAAELYLRCPSRQDKDDMSQVMPY